MTFLTNLVGGHGGGQHPVEDAPFEPSQRVGDVRDRQSAYNDAVRNNQVDKLQNEVGKSIHQWEHLAYVLQGAKSTGNGAEQYYRVVDALNLCKEKFGDFYNEVAENFKARVEQNLTGEAFLTINIAEQFPTLSDVINQSLTDALRKITGPIATELEEEMKTCIENFESNNFFEDLTLLMENVKAVLRKKIEGESELAALIKLREHPMMTEELSSEIFRRMDEQITNLVDIEVAAMRQENVTSSNFIKACKRALTLVNTHSKHMSEEWHTQKLATIFETATGLSPRNSFLTQLHALEGSTESQKEGMKAKMQTILDRNLKDRLALVKTGVTGQIDTAKKEGYQHIDELNGVMGQDWVKERKEAFMLEFVKQTPTKDAALHIQYYYSADLNEEANKTFVKKAQEIAQAETKKLAYAVAKKEEPDMSPSKATSKDLPAYFTPDFRNILGDDWVDEEFLNFTDYIKEARKFIAQGVEPSYLHPKVEELQESVSASLVESRLSGDWSALTATSPASDDLIVSTYSIDSYATLYKQVAASKDKGEIDFHSFNYGLKALAKTPYDIEKHAEWISFCDKFGLDGHRQYFEMALRFADRYARIARYRDVVRSINSGVIAYADIFAGDIDLRPIVSDRFRVAVFTSYPDLKGQILREFDWEVKNWKDHRELLATCFMDAGSAKLIEIAGGDLEKVYEHVWHLDGEPQGNDNYGEVFAFSNGFSTFVDAFWEVAREKLQAHMDSL